MAEVSLRDIRKSYGDTEVIHGVDCAIDDGEFLVIVGPSGCGKSTLLRMIAGLETITGGEVTIGDRVVNALEPADRDIAMVFQNYALYPHMTVFDNMAYGLKIRKIPKPEIASRVHKAAAILELDKDMLQRKPRQLSGGQRQRVAMGRAIVREPSVFLFDEPLSNLDAKLRVQMRIEIRKLQESLGITSVYVTHDQVEAMTLGHRLLVLNDGNVEQFGTPITLYEEPATTFVAGFIGSPAMNLMPARISDDGGSVTLPDGTAFTLGDVAFAGEPDRPVTLGVRPENFEIADKDATALTVTLVEQLGADTIVHGNLGADGINVTIRLRGVVSLAAGERLPLTVEPEHLHLFDQETGKRLG
jgi:sn-glycerol 3-phosphate transport system ATP-binding protein